MNLIEITYPKGRLDSDDRSAIAQQVLLGILGDGGAAPEATMRRARAMTHVVFHAAESWTTGDGPIPGDRPTPFLVTMTVPDAWRREIADHAIGVIHNALTSRDPAGATTRTGGDLWVNVVGVKDASIGLDGSPATADDLLMFMTEEHRAAPAEAELPDGVVADPICGMHVELDPDAITVDHDGRHVGFCSRGCRATYTRLHGIQPP